MSFCDTDIAVNCDECYELSVGDCLPILINSTLTPANVYWLICTDKFGNRYDTQVTITAGGDFSIDPDNYPSGLFNPYAGKFTFILSVSQVNVIPVSFSLSGATYSCIIAEWSVTCCNNTYVPPDACETFIDSLNATELACICANISSLCTDVCNGVDIIDQSGNIVSHVADGGTYSVLVFDTISGGASNTTYSNNVISA